MVSAVSSVEEVGKHYELHSSKNSIFKYIRFQVFLILTLSHFSSLLLDYFLFLPFLCSQIQLVKRKVVFFDVLLAQCFDGIRLPKFA